MLYITQDPYTMADHLGFAKGDSTYYGSQITNLSSYQQKNTDITIMTAEGDRVTLSTDSQRQASYLTYSGLACGGGAMAQIQGKSYSMEVNRELSITIEGNLSEEELKDIQKSIKTIDKILHEALSGNTDHALAMTNKVSSMESISSFSASLEIENTVSFGQQTIVETQTAAPEMTNEIESEGIPPSNDRFSKVTDNIMEALKHQRFDNRKLIRPLNKYFSKLFEGISEKHEGSEKSGKIRMAHRIRSEMMRRLERETQEELIKSAESESDQAIEEPTETVVAEIKEDQDLENA
ncbi:MAG: hypothetical protein JXA79_06345 [Deltaproteobacteria bacterium]|nr:hypothetical protein [Deltaproteobacteria bacterium]